MLAARLSCLALAGLPSKRGDAGGLSPSPLSAENPSASNPPPPPVLLLNMLAAQSGKGDRGELSGVGGRPGVDGNWMPKPAGVGLPGAYPLAIRRCPWGLESSEISDMKGVEGGRGGRRKREVMPIIITPC